MSLGLWIDGLTDVQRDRIVEGREWHDGSVGLPGGPRCLVGHAYAVVPDDSKGIHWTCHKALLGYPDTATVEACFDKLVRRFGLDRIVRACKLRAGADVSDLAATQLTTEAA